MTTQGSSGKRYPSLFEITARYLIVFFALFGLTSAGVILIESEVRGVAPAWSTLLDFSRGRLFGYSPIAWGFVVITTLILANRQYIRTSSAHKVAGKFPRWMSMLVVAILGLMIISFLSGCSLPPLDPKSGMKNARAESEGVLALRDGVVDLANGGFVGTQEDLSIMTKAGSQNVSRTFNSATWSWIWNFQMTYANGIFTDDIGTVYNVGALPNGPIHGSVFKKVSGSVIETRGGLRFSFASDGRLLSYRLGNHPWIETRVSGGRITELVECTSANSCTNAFTIEYDSQFRIARITDRTGRQCEYTYDTAGSLRRVRTPHDFEDNLPGTVYSYAAWITEPGNDYKQLNVTNPEYEVTRYVFNEKGRILTATKVGLGNPVTSFAYAIRVHESPFITTVTDPLNNKTVFEFNKSGQITARVSATGKRELWSWAGERIVEHRNPAGVRLVLTWNAADELSSSTLISASGRQGRRIVTTYPSHVVGINNDDPLVAVPATISDNVGAILTNTFDGWGNISSTTNGAGDTVTHTYGEGSVLTSTRAPDQVLVEFSNHNLQGLPLQMEVGDASENFEYDEQGNLTVGTDPDSRSGTQWPGTVKREFDNSSRIARLWMSQTEAGVVQDVVIRYRSDGQRIGVYRPSGADTRNRFDAHGNIVEKIECVSLPAGSIVVGSYNNDLSCTGGMSQSTRYEYTLRGELSRIIRSNGMTEEYTYDAEGRISRRVNLKNGVAESQVVYTYDAYGRVATVTDSARPNPTRFSYDVFGRVYQIDYPDGEKKRLTYTGRDLVETATYLSARVQDEVKFRTLTVYDAADREIEVRDTTTIDRLLLRRIYEQGRVVKIVEGNGLERTFSYDEFGRSVGAVTKNASGAIVETETLVRETSSAIFHSPTQAISYWAQTSSGERTTFEKYTGLRWLGVRWVGGILPDTSTAGFVSESASNTAGTSYVISPSMTLAAEVKNTTRIFEENAERNRLAKIWVRNGQWWDETAPQTLDHSYTWDSAGFAQSKDGLSIGWDAAGNMISFNGNTRVFDAEGNLVSTTEAGKTAKVLWGGIGIADANGVAHSIELSFVKVSLINTEERLYRHADFRGNVKSTSNQQGTILSINVYSPYRRERTEGDQSDTLEFARGTRWAGLLVLGERVLDPDSGWFLSPDPIEDLVHQHMYAYCDPLQFWDPTGRESQAQSSFGRDAWGAVGQGLGGALAALAAFGAGHFSTPLGGVLVGAALGPILTTSGKYAGYAAYDARGWNLAIKTELNPNGKGQFTTPGWAPHGGKTRPGGPRADGSPFSKRNKGQKEGDANTVSRSGGGGGGSGGGSHTSAGGGGGCGLLGIEPFFVLSYFLLRRRCYAHA